MTEKTYRWQITLKTGAAVTLDVVDGDGTDKIVEAWLNDLVKSKKRYMYVKINDTQVWLNPEEFAMACKSKIEQFVPPKDEEKYIPCD